MEFHRLSSAGVLLLLVGAATFIQPPRSVSEVVYAQLRLPVRGPARPKGNGVVLYTRSIHKVPPPVVQEKTKTLYKGQRRVLTPGTAGTVAVERPVHVAADGLARALSSQRVPLTPPKPTKILVGTTQPHYLVRGGVLYRYSRRLTLIATAYNASWAQNGPWGATARLNGVQLTHGMVAVDPTVIPLGTRLYVDGYGPALAADTGSAIVGDRIDLFYNLNNQQTSAFGIKKVNVYILGPQSS